MSKIKKIVLASLLFALTVVIARFMSINTEILVIGFSFIPIALAGYYLGPKYGMIVAGLADLVGANLFPFGPYFVGFTISAICKGLIYGFGLYKKEEMSKKELLIRIIISSFTVLLIVDTLMNTAWLMITKGEAFSVILSSRILTQVVMFPIQIVTLFTLINALKPIAKKYLYEEKE